MTNPLPINMMAKPTGAECNLDCAYCYYLEKEKLYPEDPNRLAMSDRVLEAFIAQNIYSSHDPVIVFAWHGGEPILRGMEFFKKVINLQTKYGAGRVIENNLQTNGTTLTDEWCRFFTDNKFLIGLSIDGPQHCHDHYRKYRDGRGTFKNCMRGVELLVKHKTDFNTLSVVNDYTSRYPLEVYRFLKGIGSRFMQFLPVVERLDPSAKNAEVSAQTVDPEEYGNFLIRIFDEWVRQDAGEYFVITFDCVLANWMRIPPPVCVSAETCGNAGVVEFNGDVYSCDHFVFPEYRLGNIHDKSLLTLMTSPVQQKFGRDKHDTLPGYCRRCEYLDLCNGECPKNRIATSPDNEPGLNYLCPGFKMFYRHTEPYFAFMADELEHNRPPSNVKKFADTMRRQQDVL